MVKKDGKGILNFINGDIYERKFKNNEVTGK